MLFEMAALLSGMPTFWCKIVFRKSSKSVCAFLLKLCFSAIATNMYWNISPEISEPSKIGVVFSSKTVSSLSSKSLPMLDSSSVLPLTFVASSTKHTNLLDSFKGKAAGAAADNSR